MSLLRLFGCYLWCCDTWNGATGLLPYCPWSIAAPCDVARACWTAIHFEKKKNKNLTWIYYILPFQISRKKKRFEILFWLSLIASSSQGSTSAAAESISIILLSWAYVIVHWTIRTDRERVGWWEVGVMIISGRVFFILCSFFFSSVSLRVMSHPPSYTKWPHVRRWIGRRNIGLIVNPLVSGCLTIEKKKGGA